ncbi:alkaline phosphatase D family protein [Stackebrandtia nassauensis]|uniref:Alkaline phosphatase n=1 Tax=Stackebrandtia nassauensis (strain DSM 44728 / CIP 108903 / NRRL B-16338 / NBRC 102104 / LLR-40K-21) TaxID=446470 RepID=D3PWC8_STANL|nr:alkaline phosphatase D family protein [Stackebrandtia nassauensis]ADD41285.1 Alkaline phosphatase [Stackebrandtia nassauensis DSM 44728]
MAYTDFRSHAELPTDPFTLGVASGDPTPDGFVLWTRLAPDPLVDEGTGGMPARDFKVKWQVSTDEKFSDIVASGAANATPKWGHSIHIEVDGLDSATEYYYRFRTGKWVSPVGRTRTTPTKNAKVDSLTMAFVSCNMYEHGYFNGYRYLAEEAPELILHLGDYTYEYGPNEYVAAGGNVRQHIGEQTFSLASYRRRQAQYKMDADLQAAHHAAPWVVVWDDHEVDNNWADEFYEKPEIPQPDFLERRENAFRAYYENMPLRRTSVPRGIDMQLYRRFSWGRLANFHMTDTRQYRDDQACGDGWKACREAYNPERSITGQEQEDWLIRGFHKSSARWDFLGNQVFFCQRDADRGPLKTGAMDVWDGYVASRNRIQQGWTDAGVRNAIVLTGDVHSAWAAELKEDYDNPDSKNVGVELVASSVSSAGNGADSIPEDNPFLKINPHVKFYNGQRGYVTTRITEEKMDVKFKVTPNVRTAETVIYTRQSYEIADGEHKLHETYRREVDKSKKLEKFDADDPTKGLEEDADDLVG